jgi:hypothetical protein
MTIGTMFTLFITPAIYSFVAGDRRKNVAPEGEVLALPDKRKQKPQSVPPMQEAAE